MLMNSLPDLFVPFPKILYLLFSRYAKGHDPGNWFVIDEETAEIKLIRTPDRESPFLVNGTYIAEILAISKGERCLSLSLTRLHFFLFLHTGDFRLFSFVSMINHLYIYELGESLRNAVVSSNL